MYTLKHQGLCASTWRHTWFPKHIPVSCDFHLWKWLSEDMEISMPLQELITHVSQENGATCLQGHRGSLPLVMSTGRRWQPAPVFWAFCREGQAGQSDRSGNGSFEQFWQVLGYRGGPQSSDTWPWDDWGQGLAYCVRGWEDCWVIPFRFHPL